MAFSGSDNERTREVDFSQIGEFTTNETFEFFLCEVAIEVISGHFAVYPNDFGDRGGCHGASHD
ncbi:hypothetical protein SCBWM1_gp46 [Synechococcus phage S-CBWM1]|uniref:Uncharacterized protein n=1 Tax=Synechococcus phage S-CBWM1 TaxID=2053653 RepID=A0A3G1L3L1_9CAUD|nr:hypothetical protein HOU61_gp151 [Synechococcus phage S-CBWM1]ATW62730.1 hypothetical protein SCBWM1_gp46 [Synechococcus phage S-CBWM1]